MNRQVEKFPELAKQVAFFEKNRETLARRHYRQHVVVHRLKIHGPFDNLVEAVMFAQEHNFKRGRYSIHRCVPKNEEPPVIFRSRVHFG